MRAEVVRRSPSDQCPTSLHLHAPPRLAPGERAQSTRGSPKGERSRGSSDGPRPPVPWQIAPRRAAAGGNTSRLEDRARRGSAASARVDRDSAPAPYRFVRGSSAKRPLRVPRTDRQSLEIPRARSPLRVDNREMNRPGGNERPREESQAPRDVVRGDVVAQATNRAPRCGGEDALTAPVSVGGAELGVNLIRPRPSTSNVYADRPLRLASSEAALFRVRRRVAPEIFPDGRSRVSRVPPNGRVGRGPAPPNAA